MVISKVIKVGAVEKDRLNEWRVKRRCNLSRQYLLLPNCYLPVSIGPGIGHTDSEWPIMSQIPMELILKLSPPNGFSSCPIP